jgi:membrane fusion protein, copper/silver efflux system
MRGATGRPESGWILVGVCGALVLLSAGYRAWRDTGADPARASARQALCSTPALKATLTTDSTPRQWTCPMHPQIVLAHPGSCPICGMTLVKMAAPSAPQGVHVEVAPSMQARMGVVLQEVAYRSVGPVLRVPVEILSDERRAVSLSPKVDGWVRKLGVSVVGQPVRKGQVLYELYSPDLQQRQRDYVDILNRRDALQAQAGPGMPTGTASPDLMLASVARERFRIRSQLAAADVPDGVLLDIEKTRHVHDVVPVLAEHDGVVTAIGAREGAFVNPSQVVLAYADQTITWAELSFTPEQLAGLRSPATVDIRDPSDAATVAQVRMDPALAVMDAATRTARVRMPLPPARALLPGTLLAAQVHLAPHRALTVPRDAVIQTGEGDFVMVADGGGFTRAAVRIGAGAGDDAEVLSGLSAGQRVVTNGQFLLGSEASLQAGRARLAAGAMAGTAKDSTSAPGV